MKSDIFISTGFGIGHLPAPGTMASLMVAAVFVLFGCHFLWLFAMMVWAIGGANIAYKPAVKIWGADPSKFVLDEILGMAVALIPVAWLDHNHADLGYSLWFAIGSFAVFRFFDILKPLGIKSIENLPDLKGVIGDDLLAAVYTIIVQVVVIFTLF